jgi:hypothetical protein
MRDREVITETLMRGKTVVITGGTSGIGEVAAIELAKMGARIVLVARDIARGNATLARLRHSAPCIAHSVHFADVLRLAEMVTGTGCGQRARRPKCAMSAGCSCKPFAVPAPSVGDDGFEIRSLGCPA